jgi:hypothetical protein
MLRTINKHLHTPKWLFWVMLAVLLLRIPSFFEPYSYGDEMIYLTLGEAIRRGIPLYSQIHDNKPPLLYIIAALAGSLFWFKAILTIWHIVTVFLFWKLSTALFPKKDKLQKISVIIFAVLTTIPFLEGNIVNAELFMIGPTIAAFLILLTPSRKKLNPKHLVSAGVLFSISTLFKVPAAFDLSAIVFLWLVLEKKINRKSIKKIAISTAYLTLGFITPIILSLVWYAIRGAFNEYLVAAFLQNVGYLSSWRPTDVSEPFWVRNAPLIQRALIVMIGLLILFWKRKKLSKQFIFITAWLLFSLFAVTLSERPYPHYLIQSVPAISLLISILFIQNNLEQSLAIIPLTLAVLVPVYFKFWYYPTTPYYSRFIKLITRRVTKDQYLSSFDGQVLTNYKIADFLVASTKRHEKVFIWGNGVAIYALARRLPPGKYVADYHIADFSSDEETMKTLRNDIPSFIIILPDSPSLPALNNLLTSNYGLIENIDGAFIWKLLNPKVRTLMKP